MIRLIHDAIDTNALLTAVQSPHCGAVCLFLGTVRDLTGDEVTEFLEYDAYPAMAERKLMDIARAAREQWPGLNLAMVHRLGKLGVGEVSVAVAASTPHRAEAFAACRFAIDQLKQLVPIWKRDHAPNGSTAWIDPTGGTP
jgi:molybdopterin synthase catalytic subunit